MSNVSNPFGPCWSEALTGPDTPLSFVAELQPPAQLSPSHPAMPSDSSQRGRKHSGGHAAKGLGLFPDKQPPQWPPFDVFHIMFYINYC